MTDHISSSDNTDRPFSETHTDDPYAEQVPLAEIGTSGIVELNDSSVTAPAKTRKVKHIERPRTLTAADIRKMRDLKTESVYVPDWNGEVLLKALTAKERDDFEDSVLRKSGKKGEREFTNKNIRAKLVVRCLINPDFTRMYTDADAEWLGDKSAPAINLLYEHAAKLSGISAADEDELEKNSLNGAGEDFE